MHHEIISNILEFIALFRCRTNALSRDSQWPTMLAVIIHLIGKVHAYFVAHSPRLATVFLCCQRPVEVWYVAAAVGFRGEPQNRCPASEQR
jgi:hypothetical protein